MPGSEIPDVKMVLPVAVPEKVAWYKFHCTPNASVREPYSVTLDKAFPFISGSFCTPVQSIFLHVAGLLLIVTISPAWLNEFASKKTSSMSEGIQFPPAPPLVSDQ